MSDLAKGDSITEATKPCPFCGGTNIYPWRGPFHRGAFAVCVDCEAQGPEARVTALDDHRLDTSDALREWNTRVNPEHLSPANSWPDIQILADGFSAALFYVLEDADLDNDINILDDSQRMERIHHAMQALSTLERLQAEQSGQERLDLEPTQP